MKIASVILTAVLFASSAAGALLKMSTMPLQWQVVELERLIREKVEDKLDSKVADNKFTVDVKIETSIPRKPNFKQAPESPPEEIKYTDAPKAASNGDYIVFSKFGMEAPIVAKSKKQTPPKKSEFEFLWKYQESQSVYKNLLGVNIKVSLNEKIPEISREALESFVKKTDLNIGEVEPEFEFAYIDFSPLAPSKKDAKNAQDAAKATGKDELKQVVEHLAIPAALVIAAAIFVAGAFLLFKKYETLKKAQLAQKQSHEGQIKLDGQNGKEAEEGSSQSGGQAAPSREDEDMAHISGLERFRDAWKNNDEAAMVLLKDWIKRDGEASKNALVYLLDKLGGAELREIFSRLTLGERQTWKGHINDTQLGKTAEDKADEFIAKEIIGSFIVPDTVTDMDLRKQILGLNEKQACLFMEDHPELAPALVNIAPSSVLSKVLAKLDPELVSKYLLEASKLASDALESSLEALKEKLAPYTAEETASPFIEKLAGLAAFCSFHEEETIFNTLIENGQKERVFKLAMDRFPSFLVSGLSDASLKAAIGAFPMAERSFIVESFDQGDFKTRLINSFAPEGSSAREMLDIELEQFTVNISAKRELEEGQDEFLTRFYDQVKETVRKDDLARTDAEKVVTQWLYPEERQEGMAA